MAVDQTAGGEAIFEARIGLKLQFLRLVSVGEARQDGVARPDAIGAAHGDLDGVLDRLGNVGEERRHFLLALEIMLGRQAAAILGDQHLALGDADQRVMRGVIIRLCEIGLVGRDQRHFEAVGEVDEALLRLALRQRAMALELDVKPVAEQALEALDVFGGKRSLSGHQRIIDGPLGPSGEADEACGVVREIVPRDMVLGILGARQVGPRGELHQIVIALLVFREKGERRDAAQPPHMLEAPLLLLDQIDPQRAADDRLDALVPHGLGEFERTEQVAGVGDRHRRHPGVLRQTGERLDLKGALGQRISSVGAQMHEDGVGLGHGDHISASGGSDASLVRG